jgi:hypothetical protein
MNSKIMMPTMLLVAGMLAGCAPAVQSGFAAGGIPSSMSSGANAPSTSAAKGILAGDEQSVKNGTLPPEILPYDQQLIVLEAESRDILASKDKVRARAWMEKYRTVMAKRGEVAQQFAAKVSARSQAVGGMPSPDGPNLCIGPMGQNLCAPTRPAPQTQRWCQVGGGGASPTGYQPCD